MVMAAQPHGRVLVKLTGVTQELTVGLGGAHASVRTLTDVSLEVRERELVVLSGSRGAGEHALLAVIAGDRRGVTGSCEVEPHTRMRLLRVSAQAALALTQEWQRCETLGYFAALASVSEREGEFARSELRQYSALMSSVQKHNNAAPPDLILLDVLPDNSNGVAAVLAADRRMRVAETPVMDGVKRRTGAARSREADAHGSAHDATNPAPNVARNPARDPASNGVLPWDEKNRAALLAWASVCRLRGGAIVMAAGDAVGNGLFDSALSHVRGERGDGPRVPSAVREVQFDASTVRVVPMHCGRLAASVRLRSSDLAV